MENFLLEMVRKQKTGVAAGIYSACTANEYAIRAVFRRALQSGQPALIEATANQVDQNGGYTGMTPAGFVKYVNRLADEMSFPREMIILGGDHLGPLTRTDWPEAEAMLYAEELVRQYVLAGFTKIHLDTSMLLADDDQNAVLADETIAARGARLCNIAEESWMQRKAKLPDAQAPVYVIGSEVPIPGGAQEAEESIQVTKPENCRKTLKTFEATFLKYNLADAWERVIGLVVQPGVEFGDSDVHIYNRSNASALTSSLNDWDQGIFEGHSTDYQTPDSLREMVQDGIAILKVGPALTFALRESLFALENIEKELYKGQSADLSEFRSVLDQQMVEKPASWHKHYHGNERELEFARAFSFSDRARYYLPEPAVKNSIKRLLDNLAQKEIPLTLLSQYLPWCYQAVREQKISNSADDIILEQIGRYIDDYLFAVIP